MNSNFFFRNSGDVASSNVSDVDSSESSESPSALLREILYFSDSCIVLLPTQIWARPESICTK